MTVGMLLTTYSRAATLPPPNDQNQSDPQKKVFSRQSAVQAFDRSTGKR